MLEIAPQGSLEELGKLVSDCVREVSSPTS